MFYLTSKMFFSVNKFWWIHSTWEQMISCIYRHDYIAQSLFDEVFPAFTVSTFLWRSDLVMHISLTLFSDRIVKLWSWKVYIWRLQLLQILIDQGSLFTLRVRKYLVPYLTHRSNVLTPMILSFMHVKCIVYYTFSGCDHSVYSSYSTDCARVTSVTLKRWWQSCRSSSGLTLTSNAAAAVWDAGLQGGVSKGLLWFYSSLFSAVSIMNWQISISFYVIVYFGTVFLPGSASCADYSSILEKYGENEQQKCVVFVGKAGVGVKW